MSRKPVERLQSGTGIEKRADETVHEYVERIAEQNDVDSDTIDDARAYITEWHYSDSPPEDDSAFRSLLQQVNGSENSTGNSGSGGDESRLHSENHETSQPGTPETPPSDTHDRVSEGSPQEGPATPADESLETDTDRRREVIGLPSDSPQRGARQAGFKTGIRGKEPRKLLLRFAAIVLTAPVIGWMIARAWVPGNQLYDEGRSLLTDILGLSGSAAVDLLAVFGIGLYVALLILFISDIKKRVQGVLLLLGAGLTATTIWFLGVFFPALEVTPLNLLSLGLGFVAGLILEADQLSKIDFSESTFERPTLEGGAVPEFRYAALVLFSLVSIVVVASFIQVVLASVVRVFDFVASGVFLILLFQFVQYDSETNYMTLGPERSGKSMLLLGLALELIQNSDTHPNPNTYLQQGLERASNLEPGSEQWPIPSTALDEVRTASFEVISGYYFPRRLELSALDYAGQHLARIADILASNSSDSQDDGVPQQVAASVATTDTLFFILDVERLVYPDVFQEAGVTDEENISWGLEHYSTILEHIDPDEVIVIATKCDILIDSDRVAPLSDYDSFATFRDAVTEHLLSRPDVRNLLQTTGASMIHPVYFATTKRDGKYVPALNENENLVPVGYDYLIDEIRKRQ